jgi:hypothetical protein
MEFVVGAPQYPVFPAPGMQNLIGAVDIISVDFASGSGGTGEWLSQDSSGVNGVGENGDRFGAVIIRR